jgi:hypothetical protein
MNKVNLCSHICHKKSGKAIPGGKSHGLTKPLIYQRIPQRIAKAEIIKGRHRSKW